jgi:hypothetical protein
MLNDIKRLPEGDPRYAKLLQDFDTACNNLCARFGSIQADKADTTARFSLCPVKREPSQLDLHLLDLMPESISTSDILDLPLRSLSFTHQLYAGDRREPVTDQFAPTNVWQTRGYADTKLTYFESTTITASVAAYTYVQFGGTQRTISVNRYSEKRAFWTTHQVPVHCPVESMAVDDNFVYLLTNDKIYRSCFLREGKADQAAIPPTPSGRFVYTFLDGAVAGFHSSSQLLFMSSSLAVRAIQTPYRGVMCMAPMRDRLVCGVPGSGVIRVIAPDGREAQSFVGHCAPVMRLIRLAETTFASSADDSTIRVWDTRDRFPVVNVSSNGLAIVNIAGSRDCLVAALHNKTMSVFDLRMAGGKAILGIATQDYEPAHLFYNQGHDALAMFGVVEKEAAKDSMMFIDNDGQSRQRIFRLYDSFVGWDAH